MNGNDTTDATALDAVDSDDKTHVIPNERNHGTSTDTAANEHVVWIGRAPPSLCVGDAPVRELFRHCGELRSVRIHHEYEDMSAEGFMFLTFATRDAAQNAVDAVQNNTLDVDGSRYYDQMQARIALLRGGAAVVERDTATTELLLGQRVAAAANARSQRNALDGFSIGNNNDSDDDDDDVVLQSLSQTAFGRSASSSQRTTSNKTNAKSKRKSKRKTTKTKSNAMDAPTDDADDGGGNAVTKRQRQQRPRTSSFLSVGRSG